VPTSFEKLPADMRRRKLQEALLAYDWQATQGALGGAILHLRKRGQIARNSARMFLILLLITVVGGLAFYLGLPFWQTYADSRESTLHDTLQTIESEEAALDAARKVLVLGDGKDEQGLVVLLKGMPEVVSSGTKGSLNGHLENGDLVLIYGQGDKVIRSDDGGVTLRAVASGTDGWLDGHIEMGGLLLLYGGDGEIVWSIDGGATFEAVSSGTAAWLSGSLYGDSELLIYGEGGTILRSNDFRPTFSAVPSGTEASLSGHVKSSSGLLLYGEGGEIIRSTDGGTSFIAFPSGTDASLHGHVEVDKGLFILGNSEIILLIYGEAGTILRSADGGATFSAVASGTKSSLNGYFKSDRRILMYGGDGAIVRSTDSGASFSVVPSETEGALLGHIENVSGLLLYGEEGTILRSTDGGANFFAVSSLTEMSLNGHVEDNGGLLIYGDEGTILRSSDGGASFSAIPSGTRASLNGHVESSGGPLIYGDSGTIVRLSDQFSTLASMLALEPKSEGDTELAVFLDETLPSHIRTWDRLDALAERHADIVTQRKALAILRERTETDLNDLEGSPLAVLQRERETVAFADFLKICRGDASPPSEPLTKSCLESWQAREEAGRSWWEVIAEQTPPGILLLFLLATLGGLYRYNLRLAGFHDSRADVLEMLSFNQTPEALSKLLTTNPGDVINQLSLAMGAEKVEMGAIRAKLAQAEIELAKALGGDKSAV
jgi:photosystem II stability/assembly factor-like uncharacterized protein